MNKDIYENYYFQDGNVRLRNVTPEDWEEYYIDSFNSENVINSSCSLSLPPNISDIKEYHEKLSNSSNDGYKRFVIENYDGQEVGSISIFEIDEQNGTFWMYPRVYDKYKGKRYATSAMMIMLRYAFFERRLNKYNAGIVGGNEASIKLHEKIGCTYEGTCRENMYINGKYYDNIYYGLLKKDFIKMYGEN